MAISCRGQLSTWSAGLRCTLTITWYCNHQYFMVYGIQQGGRWGDVYWAMVVQLYCNRVGFASVGWALKGWRTPRINLWSKTISCDGFAARRFRRLARLASVRPNLVPCINLVLPSLDPPAHTFQALESCWHAKEGLPCYLVTSCGSSGAANGRAGEEYQVKARY